MNAFDDDPRQRNRAGTRRKLWIGLGATLFGLGVAYSVFWLFVASRVTDYLSLWAEEQRQAGYVVQWDSVDISGYPFRLVATLDRPRVDGIIQGAARHWSWAVDGVTLSGRPWNWRALHLEAHGRHTLVMAETATETAEAITMDAGTLAIGVDFQGERWRHITVSGSDIKVGKNGGPVAELARFSGGLDRKHAPDELDEPDENERQRTGTIQLGFNDLAVMGLEDQLVRVVGSAIRYASLNVETYGPLPDDPSPSSLAGWRDAGGVVEVRQVRVDYGPVSLDAEGTLALDALLQPVGSFVARVQGFSETIDALRGAGMITDGDTLTAKLVLGALAKKDATTGKSHLSIPLTIQDRTVYAGPLAVAKLPPVRW